MAFFTKPEFGNVGRTGSPVNSAKNLQRKITRQARDRRTLIKIEGSSKLSAAQ